MTQTLDPTAVCDHTSNGWTRGCIACDPNAASWTAPPPTRTLTAASSQGEKRQKPTAPVPINTPPPAPSTWFPVDLTSHLDGTRKPTIPTLLQRRDGVALLYPGRVHWATGEPESGKSWLGLLGSAQVLHDGGHVVFIDLEDGAEGIVGRLRALEVPASVIADRFAYISPDAKLTYNGREQLLPHVTGAALVVIDACTEALALQGLSSKEDVDISHWLELLPRWAAKHGPAVLVIDHVVKDTETRGRWATGSGHKLAGLDGAAYLIESIQPGGVGMTGRSRLFVAKDRHGQVRPNALPSTGGRHWIGDLVVDSTGPFTDAIIQPPAATTTSFLPTVVMTKVSDVLVKANRPLSKSDLEDRVGGRAAVVRQAIAELVDAGHLTVTKGDHNAKFHTLNRPYPDPEEDR